MFKKALSIVALALGISSGSDTAVGVGSTAADMQNRVNSTLVGSKGKDSSSDTKSGSSALSGSEVFPILTERVTSKKHIQNRVGENIHNTLGLSKGRIHVSKDSSSDSDGIPLLKEKVTLALATNTQTQIGEYKENTLFPDSQRSSDSQKLKYSSDAIILADGTRFTGPELGDSHGNTLDTYFQGQKNHSNSGTIPLSSSDGAFRSSIGIRDGKFDSFDIGLFLDGKSSSYKFGLSKNPDKEKGFVAVGTSLQGKTPAGKTLSGNIIAGVGLVNQHLDAYNKNIHGQTAFLKGSAGLHFGTAELAVARQHVNGTNLASTSTTDTQKIVEDLPDSTTITEKTTLYTSSTDLKDAYQTYVSGGFNFNVGEQGVFNLSTSGIRGKNMGTGIGFKQYIPDYNASAAIAYLNNNSNNPVSVQVDKLVSRRTGLSLGANIQMNTSGKSSLKASLSLTIPLGKVSTGPYNRPMNATTRLSDAMYSLDSQNSLIPDDLPGMSRIETTNMSQVVSEKSTKTYKAPDLTVDPTKVEINPDGTVTFTVNSSIAGTTFRYQIDGGQWNIVSSSGTEQKITTKEALSAGLHTLNILAERVTPGGQKISSEIKSVPVTLSSDLATTITLDATDITSSSLLAKCNIADTDGASGTCTLKDSLGQVVKTWSIGSDTPLSGLTAGETYTLEVSGISITKNPNGSLSQKQIHQTKTIQTKSIDNTLPTAVNFSQSVALVAGEIITSQIIGKVSCVDNVGGIVNNCTFTIVDNNSDFSVNPTTGSVSVNNASISAGSREFLVMAKDKRGGSLQYNIKVDVQPNRVDNQERVTHPRIIPTRTSVSFEGGSVLDADNPSNTTVTFEYTVKDLQGNVVSSSQLKSNTEYEAFASYLTIDGKTNTLVKKTISLGVFKTLDLPTPPAPAFTIDDSSNIINWNGTNPRVYEISKDGGKTWSTPFVGQNFGDNDVDVLLRKKAISGESYAGNVQTLTFTKEPLPENTPGVLSEISGASIYIPGTTSQIYSVSFVDPDGVLSVIARVNGINTPVTKNGDTYSISLPPDMPPGKHKVDFISQGEEPDGTAELIQIESMDVTVPEEPLPVLNPDVVTGSITGSPTVVNVLSNDQAPDGKTLQLIDAKLTSGEGQVTFNTSGDVTFTPSANMIAGMAPGESKTVTVSYMVMATSSSSIARLASFVPPKVSTSILSVEYTRPALIDATVSFPTSSVTKDVGQIYSQPLVTNSTGTITYSSGNTAIATVDARSGIVSFNAPGNTVIIANQPADGKYKATTASYVVNGVALNLSGPTLSIPTVQCLLAYNIAPGVTECPTDVGDITLSGLMANDPNGLGTFTVVSSILGILASGTGNLPSTVVIPGSKIIGKYGQDDTITITSTDTHQTNPKTSSISIRIHLR